MINQDNSVSTMNNVYHNSVLTEECNLTRDYNQIYFCDAINYKNAFKLCNMLKATEKDIITLALQLVDEII